jgi:hypothetical protein
MRSSLISAAVAAVIVSVPAQPQTNRKWLSVDGERGDDQPKNASPEQKPGDKPMTVEKVKEGLYVIRGPYGRIRSAPALSKTAFQDTTTKWLRY